MKQKTVSVPVVLGLSLFYFGCQCWGVRWLAAEIFPFPYHGFEPMWFSLVITMVIASLALFGQKPFLRLFGSQSKLQGDIRIITMDWEIILVTLGFVAAVCVVSQFFSLDHWFWPLLVVNMAINAMVSRRIKLPIYCNGLTKIELVSLDWRFMVYAIILTAYLWRISWFFRGY